MADQKDRPKRRRRPAKKATSAQQALAAAEKRRQEERNKANAESVKRAQAKNPQGEVKSSTVDIYEQKARDEGYTDPEAIKHFAAKYRAEAEKKKEPSGERLSGLSMIDAMDRVTANVPKVAAAAAERRKLADPAIFGVSDRSIKERLTAQKNAADETRQKRLRKEGSAVYMGAKDAPVRGAIKGDGEFEGGQYRIPQAVQVDNIVDKNQLMAWLADEGRFSDIKNRMNKSGLDVQTYDDVAKLWKSVIDQAATTFSLTGKKVTPWALLDLRGKQMVNGRPAAKTTTQVSTDIEELDPAQARLMVEKAAQDLLGRRPTNEEVDDFVAKAQMIASQNPRVTNTTTTTQFGFDGEATSSSSTSKSRGGADVVAAQSQLAAQDEAMQDEEYGAYQAAGVYFPMLFDAINAPV